MDRQDAPAGRLAPQELTTHREGESNCPRATLNGEELFWACLRTAEAGRRPSSSVFFVRRLTFNPFPESNLGAIVFCGNRPPFSPVSRYEMAADASVREASRGT